MSNIFEIGQKTTIKAGLITIFFAFAKAIAGFLSGSVALLADSVHSFADSFSSFAAWFGLKIAKKEPTQKFPYGFYKIENIAALLISFLILFAGWTIIKESITKITTEPQLSIPFVAIAVATLDAIVMFLIGTYEIKIGKEINAQSLMADGKESRMHLLSSSIVLAGLISTLLKIPYLEAGAGIAISIFIFQAGVNSAKDSIFALLDSSPEPEIKRKIEKILKDTSEIKEYSNLKLRKSGPFVFGETEAEISKTASIKKADEISRKIEKEIKSSIKTIDSFFISFKPVKLKKEKICVPVKNNKELNSEISQHFARAPFFFFATVEKGKIIEDYIKENPFREKEMRAGLASAKFIAQEGIESVITKEIGPIPLNSLKENLIDIYKSKGKIIREVLENYHKEKLDYLEKPTKEKL